MRILKNILFFTLLCTFSCGTQTHNNPANLTAGIARNHTPLILMMGGRDFFGTCDLRSSTARNYEFGFSFDFHNKFMHLLNDARIDSVKSDIVYSCFNGRELIFADAKNINKRHATKNITEYHKFIENIYKRLPNRQIFVIGHSYGGWLAMHTSLKLPQLAITSLYTIDPISFPRCSYLFPSGCTEAPTDITTVNRKTIAQRTQSWMNFYQKRFLILHSDHIAEADLNDQISASHIEIVDDLNVWKQITADIKKRIR